MAINELRSISIFAKAAELGSLRKAAAALDISPQAASRRWPSWSNTLTCGCSTARRA